MELLCVVCLFVVLLFVVCLFVLFVFFCPLEISSFLLRFSSQRSEFTIQSKRSVRIESGDKTAFVFIWIDDLQFGSRKRFLLHDIKNPGTTDFSNFYVSSPPKFQRNLLFPIYLWYSVKETNVVTFIFQWAEYNIDMIYHAERSSYDASVEDTPCCVLLHNLFFFIFRWFYIYLWILVHSQRK